MKTLLATLLLTLTACATNETTGTPATPRDPYYRQFEIVLDEDYSTGELVYVYSFSIDQDCGNYWAQQILDRGPVTEDGRREWIGILYNRCCHTCGTSSATMYSPVDEMMPYMFPPTITVKVR